jgi:hypothetical protein
MLSIKNKESNYLAKVVKIDNLIPHPNADRLQLAKIGFQKVITGLDAKIGDLYIYFPLESAINNDFLSFTNSFSSSNLNLDPEKKGYFGRHRRIKALKLRDVMSEGYIHPIKSVNDWLGYAGINYQIQEKDVNKEFDSIGDILFCQKYIVVKKIAGTQPAANKHVVRKVEKLVENQFIQILSNSKEKWLKSVQMIGLTHLQNGTGRTQSSEKFLITDRYL